MKKFKDFLKSYRFITYNETVDCEDQNGKKKDKKKCEPVKYDGTNLLYFLQQNAIRND